MVTIVFNKPYGVLTKFTDDADRPTLADYIDIPDIYPAGRLDKDSEGLLILTNDGVLNQRITHPHSKLPKTYWAQLEHIPSDEALENLRQGVLIKGGQTRPAQVERLPDDPGLPPRPVPIRYRKNVPTAWIALTLTEGRNRQVRRMTAAVGHPTLRLVRVAVGPISLNDLATGTWRDLSIQEYRSIMDQTS
ncbi:MAG: pseudouridine synthase [Anaerolineae bacterium]